MCMLALGFGASAQIALPYTETFATIPAANGFPVVAGGAWTRSGSTTAQPTYITNQTSYNRSGNGDTFFITYYYSGNTTGNYYFVGPFDLTAGTSYTSSILYKADGLNGFGPLDLRFGTAATAATQTNLIATVPANITNTAFQKLSGAFTVPTTGSYYLSVKETNTSSPWYLTLDDFKLSVTPSCIEPTALTNSNVTTTTADVSWTASTTPPANGYEVYYSTSSTAPTASSTPNMTGVIGTTANLTGLMSSSVYYAYVRSACSAADKSEWSAVTKFTTLCTPFSIPYTENFDTTAVGSSTATNAPTCWTYLETASSAGYGYVNTTTPASTPNNYYLYNSSDNTGNIMLVSPETTNLTNGLNRVRFNARGLAGYVLQIGTVTNNTDPTTFAAISSITLTGTNTQYIVDIPAGTNTYLSFKHGLGGTFRNIYIDDITVELIPSCVAPTSPMHTGSTSSSLSYTWTAPAIAPANGYQVYYSTTNTAPTAATVLDATNSVSSATTSAMISGLTADTVYYVWVRSNCAAADQSVWVSAGSANTGYCAVSTTGQASYFTSLTSSGAITNLAYSNAGSAGIAPGYQNLTATNKISNFAGSTTNIGIGLAGTTVGVTIWVDWNNNLIFETTEKVFGTTGYVSTISGASITAPVGTAIGNYRTRAVVNYNNGTPSNPCEIVTRGEYIDFTFEVTAPPSCLAPTALVVSGTTTTGATISWTASSSNPTNGYEIYYSTTNTAPTAATVASTTSATTSVNLTGLTPNTTYYVWVRSNCGGSESTWSNSATLFTGYCTPAPISVDGTGITNVTFGSSPNVVNNTTVAETGNYGNYSSMIGDVPVGVSTQVAITYQTSYTYGTKIWVDLNNNLVFDAAELLYTGLSASASPTTLLATIIIPSATPLGNYRMRIGGTDTDTGPDTACYTGSYGTFEDYTVNVIAPPTCLAPTALAIANITMTTADLSWTAPSTAPALGYEVYYSTANTAPTAMTSPTTTSTATMTGLTMLTPSTLYYVWVRSNCSAADQSTWVALPSFTTVTPPPANDECSTPNAITPGAMFTQNPITATNVAGTNTADATAVHACQSSANKDVWFSVVVPASGNITIETKPITGSSFTDSVLAVYSGSCGTLTSLGCNDDDGDGSMSMLSLTGQAPGSTLLIAVFNYSSTTTGDFQISAYDGSLATGETIVKDDKSFTIAPNPFTDVVRISDVKDVVSISVVDLSGRIVKTVKPAREINLGDLKTGMYLINLTMKDGSVKTVKAIKK